MAFGNCIRLKSITVDDDNKNYSNDDCGVMFNKDKTVLKQYPVGNSRIDYTIPDGVTSIGDWAFYDCATLRSVTIPDSVTSIKLNAFRDCTRLANITIPDSVTSISEGAFDNIEYYHYESSWENNVLYIGNHLIEAADGVTDSDIIKDGTKTIAKYAFDVCTDLESITIPDSVTNINDWAFYDCTGLKSITIPNSVTSIGEGAFCDCASLTDIYYSGTKAEWNAVTIGDGNGWLTEATIHFNDENALN